MSAIASAPLPIVPPTPLAPPAPTPLPPDVPTLPIYRLSVEQYHKMIDAGILTPNDRVELLSGWLVPKMTKKYAHTQSTRAFRVRMESLGVTGWFVQSQEPITLTASEPEPDGMVVRGTFEQYVNHPTPANVSLVAEVADSTLAQDRDEKQQIYAEARIPVYWIINLVDRQVEVYTDPSGPAALPRYRQVRTFGESDVVPVELDGRQVGQVAVRDLLP